MSGFVRRFTEVQSIDVIRQIEGVSIIDLAPPAPATGAGTGTVLLVGEFEDGGFATDTALGVKGALEVFGAADMTRKFGGFGFTYGTSRSQNPCARRHLQELWNGSGYIKSFKLRAQRLLLSRVDVSVGSVSFDPLASIDGGTGPFVIPTATTLGFTSNSGSASTAAVTGVVATSPGAAAAFGTILSGDSFGISIDGGAVTTITFSATDITLNAVKARINAAMGYTCAVTDVLQVDLLGLVPGTAGKVTLTNVAAGTLAKIGHVVGTTAGTGSVANINAVTAAEVASLVNASVPLGAINVGAAVNPSGTLRVLNKVSGITASISASIGGNGVLLGFVEGLVVLASGHAAGSIAAGTRVTDGTTVWVTMQSLDIPDGVLGPYVVRVRPALDDGSALGAAINAVVTVTDQPGFSQLTVRNSQAVTAALTENQIDAAYQRALDATLDESGVCRDANYLLCARRSDALVRGGQANAASATANGLFARKFVTGDPLGTTISQILANVALYRSDRVFYTGKALKVLIPAIAEQGTAGGLGFTADGVITVRPDGPLTTICATLGVAENPGQQTGLIEDFFSVDSGGEVLSIDAYKAFKAAGAVVPRVDRTSGTIFQSGVTTSLESGRKNIARRKVADSIQDTLTELIAPYTKKLSTQRRRDAIRSVIEQYLASLVSANNPAASVIQEFSVSDGVNAGNTPEVLALGVFYIQAVVRSYASLDDIVIQTEIGENANIVKVA